ncbi:MAG: alpha/beta hydrolase [Planctomycetota bacterium]
MAAEIEAEQEAADGWIREMTRSVPCLAAPWRNPLCSLALLVLVGLPAVAGCSSFQAADPSRLRSVWYPEPIPDAWWPARQKLASASWELPPDRLLRDAAVEEGSEVVKHHPFLRVVTTMPCGQGLVRALRPTDREGNLLAADRMPQFDFVSASDPSSIDLSRVGELFELVEPDGPPRGLVVGVAGSRGAEAAEDLFSELLDRGYAVLRTSMTRVVRQKVTVHLLGDRDLDPAAREIAAAVDDRLAEKAYAIEAMLEYLAARRPDLPRKPLVLAGFASGAAALPVAAARLGSRVDAAVLVAAGANLLEVSLTGKEIETGIEVICGDYELVGRDLRWLSDLYLAESRLDPFHTSRFLGRSPVLILHSRFDEVVPAWTGELLYQRLGRPDRLRILGGHDSALGHASSEAEWVGDWIDQACGIR